MKNMPVIDESRKRKAEDSSQPSKKSKVELEVGCLWDFDWVEIEITVKPVETTPVGTSYSSSNYGSMWMTNPVLY